jgi:hypothetical protein
MIRKVLAIASLEIRLLLRAKSRLSGTLVVPIAGAAFFGLIGRASACSVASLGIFPVLALSAILLATGPNLSPILLDLLQPDYAPNQGTVIASWAVPTTVVLVGQSVLYNAVATLIPHSSAPGTVRTLIAILLALLLGLIALKIAKLR